MRAAIVNDATGVVLNVVIVGEGWNPPAGHSVVEAGPGAAPGAIYDAGSGTFAPPAGQAAQITRAEFVRRLGPANLATIMAVAAADPQVAFFVKLTELAEYVDQSEAEPALLMLEAAEVLPEGTAAEVFG